MGWVHRLPEVGERVGDYVITDKLGSGSHGHVYKAEQAGRFYAVKFLQGRLLHDRARREIRILIHLDHPDVVRFYGCGYWPDPVIGHSYLVMEFAGGRTLETCVLEENPPARRCVRIVWDTALTLGEVLRQGVLHRDLKPDNIIIRDENARPLLIDFGVGTLVGVPATTGSRLPPGTPEFRAPEAWRFSQETADGSASYDYGPADELWALGVNFYWLLTDVLPFGDREETEGGGVGERILHQSPVAPHLLNPRVPRVLSDICMRMLEKDPASRYGSVVELCAALDAAMAGADASWDLPLFEPDAPHSRTTEEEPTLADANDSMRWLRRWMKEKPRRGRKPPGKAPARAPETVTEVLATEPERKPPVVAVTRHRARIAVAAGLVVMVLGVSLFSLSRLFQSRSEQTRQAESGHEVARTEKPPDPPVGEGAGFTMDSISAPVMITMLSKDGSEKKMKVLGSAGKALGTAAVCAVMSGCPAAQVRLTPLEPAPCPAGAVKAMADRLGVRVGETFSAYLNPEGHEEVITVEEGATSVQLGPRRSRESGGIIFLSGTLIVGEERVYGRFTQARDLKGDGQPFPVCFEMRDNFKGGRGVIRARDRGPNTIRILSTAAVTVVRQFD